VPRRGLEPPSG